MSHKPKTATHSPVSGVIPPTAQRPTATIPSFDLMPDSALIRESQLVQSPKRPGVPAPLPFSGPTLWRKVAAGTFPPPLKLSKRVTAWRVGDVRTWLSTLATE